MTTQEKAEEIFYKMLKQSMSSDDISALFRAKQCALIVVDEILEALELNTWQNQKQIEYYQEVKQEIEKI